MGDGTKQKYRDAETEMREGARLSSRIPENSGTVQEQDKIRCHPKACKKAQREPGSKSEVTSPHKHRRTVNADKRKLKRKKSMRAKGEMPVNHMNGNQRGMGMQENKTFKQNNQMAQQVEVPKCEKDGS